MASAAGPFPIFYNTDVHNFYLKQKQEFHFNQKSDNEFLMFLLDTAVRVISIVQHLAPVIEAVSEATDVEENEEMYSDVPSIEENASGLMEVEAPTSLLSAELQQINQEISSVQNTNPSFPSPPVPHANSTPITDSSKLDTSLTVAEILPPIPIQKPPTSNIPTVPVQQPVRTTHETNLANSCILPNTPAIQLPSSAQPSATQSTILPPATQPVASARNVKNEEVVEIKEETKAAPELVTQGEFESLVSTISSNTGLQNFVPTASLSSLPPSFLERGSSNPLTMVGSITSGNGPGPSGINLESNTKSQTESGTDVNSNSKGPSNTMSGRLGLLHTAMWGGNMLAGRTRRTFSSVQMAQLNKMWELSGGKPTEEQLQHLATEMMCDMKRLRKYFSNRRYEANMAEKRKLFKSRTRSG